MTRDVGPNSSERRSPAPWRLSKLKIPLLPARRGAGAAGGGCRGMLSTTGPAKGMGLGSRSPSSSWHLAGLRSQNVPLESTGMGDLGWGICRQGQWEAWLGLLPSRFHLPAPCTSTRLGTVWGWSSRGGRCRQPEGWINLTRRSRSRHLGELGALKGEI